MTATNLLAGYGCVRIMSSTEVCSNGSATYYVVCELFLMLPVI